MKIQDEPHSLFDINKNKKIKIDAKKSQVHYAKVKL